MVITKQCPFCSRIKALDLNKIVGEVQTCECGALYVTGIDSNLVETGDWLKNKCSCCGGQIKITGIFPMDTGDMICWACENYTGEDGHESGNFTVVNSHKLDFLPSRMERDLP